MTVAVTHLSGWLVTPVALVAAALAASYWHRLGADRVPASRRRIRRTSLTLMLASLPLFTAGLGFIDPQRAATAYVLVWTGGMVLLGLVLFTALLDAMNTSRLARQQRHDLIVSQATDLVAEVRRHRDGAPSGGGEP